MTSIYQSFASYVLPTGHFAKLMALWIRFMPSIYQGLASYVLLNGHLVKLMALWIGCNAIHLPGFCQLRFTKRTPCEIDGTLDWKKCHPFTREVFHFS